jgi:ABC-2 type transport system ATP-binding protein
MLAAAGKAILFSSPVLEQVDQLCSHLLLLRRGAAVASGTMEEMRAGPEGCSGELSLETRVMQLTEQVDAGEIARNLLAAAMAPSR